MASFEYFISSQRSKPTKGWSYDVFLSFRGEDTRYNFVDHLYTGLVQKGINVFKDDKMLCRGKPISSELLKAIEESRFAVVVFSENYANSSWCLEELAKIMECQALMQQTVLPVFYYVDPSDVRRQSKRIATAFEEHEEKYREEMEKVNTWRNALTAAANLSGFAISKTLKEGESTVVTNIVQEIFNGIQPQRLEKNLIGIESRIDELNKLLDMEATEDVRIVGIYGMGGIGKTTIAQALFRRTFYKFEGSSFVKDVRENSKRGICALQEKILKDLLHLESKIKDPVIGAEMIRTRLCAKKILLVLDDVDDLKQLEFLAETSKCFGPGSRIIITTRDEHLLSNVNAKYKPTLLLMDQAVELFSRYAFRENSPPDEYNELSYRAISYTGCLPLALKVLGSFFRGRKASVWVDALNRLAETPNDEIFKSLKLSFDGLNVLEKKIFLDIACFFKGKAVEDVTVIHDCCGFYPMIGINVLIEKSLITISNERLEMHDLIQEMGLQIVRQTFPNSRLWRLEEIHDFIKKNRKLKAIEAIVAPAGDIYVDESDDEKLGFNANVFKTMRNLRLLHIQGKFTSCEPIILPDEIRWLCWNDYPFFTLPISQMPKLAGLNMEFGNIQHLWKNQTIMRNLKFINLHHLEFLKLFPDVSGAPNIERLVLSDCTGLVEVHESVGFLKRLVYLNMSNCWNLKSLPSRIEMECLETLILCDCDNLERIPEVSPCMEKLSHIDLGGCYGIEELPLSIRYLSRLRFMNLAYCINLKTIPNSICELKSLRSLCLDNCRELQKLPEGFGSMEKLEELLLGSGSHLNRKEGLSKSINFDALTSLYSLRKLDLSGREIREEDFKKNLYGFSALEELDLSYNSKLFQLPAGISHLSHLKYLDVHECCNLQVLDGLPSGIQVLQASNCKSLKKIENLSKRHEWLYHISLDNCQKLLDDRENERYLDLMLMQSFLMKCVAVDRCISICVPGSKIPSWVSEQQHGGKITLNLPPKWQCRITGFAICGLFDQWEDHLFPSIEFKFEKDAVLASKTLEFDSINALATVENGNVYIGYVPFSRFQEPKHDDDDDGDDLQAEDWSHDIVQGNRLTVTLWFNNHKTVTCGGYVVYKEDVESIHQIKPSISSYWNWKSGGWIQNFITFTDSLKM